MRVYYACSYYSDLAHNRVKRRPEPYWDSRNFVYAVKTGIYKRPFNVPRPNGNVPIRENNVGLARQWFGEYVLECLKAENVKDDVLLIPVPSKDAKYEAQTYRSLEMLVQALSGTQYVSQVCDGLIWEAQLQRSHEGGVRSRDEYRRKMLLRYDLKGRDVVLIDDLITTGASILAAADVLRSCGANVLGSIACGKTVYDFNTAPFCYSHFELTEVLKDFHG